MEKLIYNRPTQQEIRKEVFQEENKWSMVLASIQRKKTSKSNYIRKYNRKYEYISK